MQCITEKPFDRRLFVTGVAVYNFSLKDVPLRKMFLYTSLLGAVLGMTQILLITGAPPAFTTGPSHLCCSQVQLSAGVSFDVMP